MKAIGAKAGVSIDVGSGFKAYFVAPGGSTYEDLNNYSAVLKIEFGSTAYMLTGDAEDVSEGEMLASGMNLTADLLKVGHHGSSYSSTASFLQVVKPAYAVISVGADNDYGHPAAETINRLQSIGVKVYRTDQQGTIIVTSDGTSIVVDKSPTTVTEPTSNSLPSNSLPSTNNVEPAQAENSGQYIGNKNSKKLHLPSCRSLPNPENRIFFNSREEAISQGFLPCGICKP